MAGSLRDLRRKTKAVQHIRQITRAMKMVATAKLKRIQRTVENSRRYQEELRRLLADVANASVEVDHPYLQAREVERSVLPPIEQMRRTIDEADRKVDTLVTSTTGTLDTFLRQSTERMDVLMSSVEAVASDPR